MLYRKESMSLSHPYLGHCPSLLFSRKCTSTKKNRIIDLCPMFSYFSMPIDIYIYEFIFKCLINTGFHHFFLQICWVYILAIKMFSSYILSKFSYGQMVQRRFEFGSDLKMHANMYVQNNFSVPTFTCLID